MHSKRIGLVLEGGGAKGAYAFGVLKAFAECKIGFSAVAGTSVGSLNAALWASDRLARGQDIWEQLAVESVYPHRSPRWLFKSITPFVLVLHAARAYFNYAIAAEEPRLHRLATRAHAVLVGGMVLFAAVGFWMQSFLLAWIPTLLALALSEQYLTAMRHRRFAMRRVIIKLLLVSGLIIGEGLLFLVGRALGFPEWLMFVMAFGFFVAFFVLAFFALLLGGIALDELHVRSNSPLRAKIYDVLKDAALAVPVFATLAEKRSLFDPDDHYVESDKHGLQKWYACKQGYVPDYVRLDTVDSAQRADMLLASAALPLGIVASIKIGDHKYVDGGMVDNCPIYPLTTLFPCSTVVVVRLRPGGTDAAVEHRRWSHIRRILQVAEYPPPGAMFYSKSVHNDPPVELPYETPADFPELLFLAPSRKLGGCFSGTLNFRPSMPAA